MKGVSLVPPSGPRHAVNGVLVAPDAVIGFPEGLPGFEQSRLFVLLSAPELEPFQQLRSVTGPEASFLVVDPRRVLPDYRCRLDAHDRDKLAAADREPLLWLAIVAVDEAGNATVNLRAPVVINPRTMTGLQVMPHRGLYALHHPLTATT